MASGAYTHMHTLADESDYKKLNALGTSFKCVCVTTCSLAMSLFSCDCIKSEIDYQTCLTYLQVHNIHTAPGFNINACFFLKPVCKYESL